MRFKVVERVKLWLGWCPKYDVEKAFVDFGVESQDNTVSGEGSSKPVSAINLDSVKWLDIWHNNVFVTIGAVTMFFLLPFIRGVSKFIRVEALEVFLIGFSVGTLFVLVSTYRGF